MPSPFRSPKTLPEWIELDYYSRPRRLRGAKLWLSVVVLLVGALGVGALTFLPRHKLLYQAGPLSTAHFMFNQDCGVCHTQAFQTATRLWPGNARIHAVPNEACTNCHDGPRHAEQEAFTPDCTGCHREHRGRDHLAWIVDGHCIDCHADLKRRDGQPSKYAASIHSFTGDHPEFAVLRESRPDPAAIRFNHEVHLRSDLKDPDGGVAKLECASCHIPDAGRRYMQPVNFDNHCKRCHPLEFQVVLEGGNDSLGKAAQRLRRERVPHGQPPVVVDAVVYERLLKFADQHPAVLEQTPPEAKRPFPGKAEPTARRYPSSRAWADRQQQYARRQLLEGAAGCRFCHQVAPERDGRGLPLVAAPNIPRRWFQYGEFNHGDHRLLNCAECHAKAATSSSTRDVLLPGIDNCRQCHTPAVGARSACVECHRYHDRKPSGWHGTMSIQEALGSHR